MVSNTCAMPRPGFQARKTNAGAKAQADAFEALAGQELAGPTMTRLDQLEGLVRENRKEPKREKATRARIFARFAGQFRHSDRAESTLLESLSVFRRFAVDPWDLEPAPHTQGKPGTTSVSSEGTAREGESGNEV